MAIAIAAGSLLAPPSASADTAAEARYHDDRARRFYRQGRYEAAIQEFFLEQRLVPSARVLFNIGLCFVELGRESDAFLALSEYLASLGPDDPDDGRRARAERRLEQLAPVVARVSVETTPPGATIYVDEVENGSYGQTPFLLAVPPGEHELILELPGHRPATVPVASGAGQLAEVSVTLEAVLGTLEVASLPPGDVRVLDTDGAVVAEGPSPFSERLAPATYQVEIDRAGYQTSRDIVQIGEDETSRMTPALRPLPEPTGRLTVTSNVSGATVFVDDEPVGFTPLILPQVTAGPHVLRVEADDRQSFRGPFEVTPETPSWATVTLEGDDVDRHSPATWVLGAGGIAALSAGGIVGILAILNKRDYDDNPDADTRERGTTLNATADVLWITGAAALTAAIILYVIEDGREERSSRGTVTSGTGVAE